MYTCLKNARILLPDRMLEQHSILIENDRIINVFPDDSIELPNDCKVRDLEGKYVAPGFVDIHCHGDKENWFYDDPATASQYHLKHGTTSVMATTRLLPTHEELVESIKNIVKGIEDDPNTTIMGIHMECPYLNPDYGAYSDRSRNPKKEEYLEFLEAGKGHIKTWTIAPELENMTQMVADIQVVTKGQVIFQVGHSAASYQQIEALYPSGLKIGTHLTNASGAFVDPPKFEGTREVGVDEAVWLDKDMYAEIIVDSQGSHVRPEMLKLIMQIKGIERTIIVTDTTVAEYAAPPQYEGIDDVNYTDDGELMGSALTMDTAVSNLLRQTDVSLVDVFRMATFNPAEAIDMDNEIGLIAPGRLANLLIFDYKQDEDLEFQEIIYKGETE